jgi:mannitol/fructose-specific phosphotransferase system IIA component (Ntr-type)
MKMSKQKKWIVEASETVYYWMEIEAETREEAIEIAMEEVTQADIVETDGFTIDNVEEMKDEPRNR